jgi:hypothetical protein
MSVAMKRRAYIKILGIDCVQITNNYNNRVFNLDTKIYEEYIIDLIKLEMFPLDSETIFSRSSVHFYAHIYAYKNSGLMIMVMNEDTSVGYLSTDQGYSKEQNFVCAIVED